MSDRSTIEWTDATWNPVRGCVKVSPGCKHCYAETFAERFRGVRGDPRAGRGQVVKIEELDVAAPLPRHRPQHDAQPVRSLPEPRFTRERGCDARHRFADGCVPDSEYRGDLPLRQPAGCMREIERDGSGHVT